MSRAAAKTRFLVVGASGLVGRALMPWLESRGHPAIGTQVSMKRPGLVGFDLRTDRIADKVGPAFFSDGTPTVAVVCASICQIDRCFREREVARLVNVVNTLRLIDDLSARGVKPVFISSGYVFDGERGYYCEEHERRPVCEYGRHKQAVEEHVLSRIPGALVLRLDKVVGDDPAQEHLLTEWHRWLAAGRPVTCIAGQVFSPTLVKDVARAVTRVVDLDLKGLYHVANPEFFSREELARQFALALGREAAIESKPQSEFAFDDPRPLKTYLDATKFIKAADFRFTSMRETFADFRARLGRLTS
ncbi:MAG: sugar nucleotide-binding protein [Elusimicrobia bacterium]|nr:sugar nucleotide-binding protein [Elusimicrobiota bacterium]